MALAKDLDIYKVAYDLFALAADCIQQMPRSVKKVIGDRLQDRCMDLLTLIYETNKAARDARWQLLERLLNRLHQLEILLQLCSDKRYIAPKKYAGCIELTTSIGKQATKWRNSYAASPVA
jgi:hypothetical protein